MNIGDYFRWSISEIISSKMAVDHCCPNGQQMGNKKPCSGNPEQGLGAGDVARTRDLLITSEMLYLLSYTSIFVIFRYFSELFDQIVSSAFWKGENVLI